MKTKNIYKHFHYKGWFCRWNKTEQLFWLFTPSEMEQPLGFREWETEVSTAEQAKAFIDGYNKN